MKLYFSPLACSLATRIALYEADAEAGATFVEVFESKATSEGSDLRDVHPLGLVPVLVLDDGAVLTENAAVLQWVAAAHPHAKLLPDDALGRARLREWLCFIGTELHKALFVPLLDPNAPADAKAYALEKAESRLGHVERTLAASHGDGWLLGPFSVADGYLFAVLNWTQVAPVKLGAYPAITGFMERMRARPAVARAFQEEWALYAKRGRKEAAGSAEERAASRA